MPSSFGRQIARSCNKAGFDQKGDITAPGYVLYVWKKGKFEYAE